MKQTASKQTITVHRQTVRDRDRLKQTDDKDYLTKYYYDTHTDYKKTPNRHEKNTLTKTLRTNKRNLHMDRQIATITFLQIPCSTTTDRQTDSN